MPTVEGPGFESEHRSASLPSFIEAMLESDFYPHRPEKISLVQTHISYVLLAGSEVYKVKKGVRYSFLDFSDLARRRHFCREEVRLNRRLAPDTYRGVVSICRSGSGYRLGTEGDPAATEYAVQMRRLPEGRMLDRLLDRNEVTHAMLDQLAACLVRFHAAAEAGDAVAANGDPSAVGRIIGDNFAGMRPFRGVTVDGADDAAIQDFTAEYLRHNAGLLRKRQREHRIRDGHGDLHAEHVCFGDSLVIYDCIEFNPGYRYCDVASDIAFLVMDMTYHGQAELAAYFLDRYARLSGDDELRELVPFYACYRAYVRGKVDSLKSAEPEVDAAEREAARRSARRHFALAYRYTWLSRPCLVLIAGFSGAGKSTLARGLSERTGFAWLSSDVIRKELAGLPPDAPGRSPRDSGIYTPEFSARTYETLFDRAEAELSAGRGVIVDATFQRRSGRLWAREMARKRALPFLLVECRCSEAVVRERLGRRLRAGRDPSDADWSVYVDQRRNFEPFDDREEVDRLVVDTAREAAVVVAEVEQVLRQQPWRFARG